MNLYELTQDEVLELRLQATHFNIYYHDYKKYRSTVDKLVAEICKCLSKNTIIASDWLPV